jgi:hypothetical protein
VQSLDTFAVEEDPKIVRMIYSFADFSQQGNSRISFKVLGAILFYFYAVHIFFSTFWKNSQYYDNAAIKENQRWIIGYIII